MVRLSGGIRSRRRMSLGRECTTLATPMCQSACRVPLCMLLAVVYVALLAWQSPHLVHHVFEAPAEAAGECAFAATADHAPPATASAPPVAPPVGARADHAVGSPIPADHRPAPGPARAPPSLA